MSSINNILSPTDSNVLLSKEVKPIYRPMYKYKLQDAISLQRSKAALAHLFRNHEERFSILPLPQESSLDPVFPQPQESPLESPVLPLSQESPLEEHQIKKKDVEERENEIISVYTTILVDLC
ncbi:hypothetical protein RCL_jg20559.t1 [Rhizophagus clarus]|uniref:Uncharacterized protein n=1 Tax=Rhizophagus clarus TaxID=94130 RepID=A0A8H3LDQ7_9GLOM|nr:hypothetical protein RCL_jg20559.t1 [Rhizophagus clarus]